MVFYLKGGGRRLITRKTTSDNIEMLRAILGAYRKKVSLVIYVFRMRHKDVNDAWNDLLKLL